MGGRRKCQADFFRFLLGAIGAKHNICIGMFENPLVSIDRVRARGRVHAVSTMPRDVRSVGPSELDVAQDFGLMSQYVLSEATSCSKHGVPSDLGVA